MLFKVYKYVLHTEHLDSNSELLLRLPKGSQILSVGSQHDTSICLWALVNPEAAHEDVHRIAIYGTGHEITANAVINSLSEQSIVDEAIDTIGSGKVLKFLGSAQLMNGRLVFHIFEVF